MTMIKTDLSFSSHSHSKHMSMQFFLFHYFHYRMCAVLLPETSSFAAAILFAVHPIHTEAVSQFFLVYAYNF